jgi:hypothetical protein
VPVGNKARNNTLNTYFNNFTWFVWLESPRVRLWGDSFPTVDAIHSGCMQSLHGRASIVVLIRLAAVAWKGAVVVGVRNWPTQLKHQPATLNWVDVMCLFCGNSAKVCCCSCQRLTSGASGCPPVLLAALVGQCMVICSSEDVCGGCLHYQSKGC